MNECRLLRRPSIAGVLPVVSSGLTEALIGRDEVT